MPESRVKILIIPTNEELQIARETMDVLNSGAGEVIASTVRRH